MATSLIVVGVAMIVVGVAMPLLGAYMFRASRRLDKDIENYPEEKEGECPRRTEVLPDGKVLMKGRSEGPFYGAWAIEHEGRVLYCPELWWDSQERAERAAEDHRRIGYESVVKRAVWRDNTENWTVWTRELPKEQLRAYLFKRILHGPIMFKRYAWTPSWALMAMIVAMPLVLLFVLIVIPLLRGESL